jgi:hypothetical protein
MPEFTGKDLIQEIEKIDKKQSLELKSRFQKYYDGFWEFQKYMDDSKKTGYSDEQIDVKLVAFCMYLLIWGYIHKMVLSMPRRRRKSHAVNDAVKYVVGFMPDRSNARYSHNEMLAKKHSKIIRREIMSYKFKNVFPNVELKPDSRSALEWEVYQCQGEPTYHCAGVGGTATGYGVNKLLIGDDLVKGWVEAHSESEKEILDYFISGNFESCEEAGMSLLYPATRWADDDPSGKLIKKTQLSNNRIFTYDAYYTKLTDDNINKFIKYIVDSKPTKDDLLVIRIPALDKDDETTCPYHELFTTEYYRKIRDNYFANGEDYIWYSIYQQEPRERGTLLFSDFNNYYKLEDLKKIKFTGGVAYLDPAGKGNNNTCIGLARIVNNKVYIMPDIIYTPEKPQIAKELIVLWLKKYHQYIDKIFAEGNGGGYEFCINLTEKLVKENIPLTFDDTNIINTNQNKELKIFLSSDYISNNVYLPAEYDDNGNRQYDVDSPIDRCIKALTKYIGKVNGKFVKNQEDDFLDFLCGIKEIVSEDDREFDYYLY